MPCVVFTRYRVQPKLTPATPNRRQQTSLQLWGPTTAPHPSRHTGCATDPRTTPSFRSPVFPPLFFQAGVSSVSSAPAPALGLLDRTIAALEASLGLQPGGAVGLTATANSKKTGETGRDSQPRAKGKGNAGSSENKGGQGWCSPDFFSEEIAVHRNEAIPSPLARALLP